MTQTCAAARWALALSFALCAAACGGATATVAPVRAAAVGAAAATAAAATATRPWPTTRRGDTVDDYHGTKVADPYRWLEDPDTPESRAWIQAQNAATAAHLGGIASLGPIGARLGALWDFDRRAPPRRIGERTFQLRQTGLQNQPQLFVHDRKGGERILLDPNTLAADGTVALKDASISDDGALVAWMTSSAGSDWAEIRVRDVATGTDRPDHITWVKFSGIAWAKDGSGFYYSRYDAPPADKSLQAVNEYHKLYFHRLGTPQSDDLLVQQSREHKDWGFGAEVSHDGRLLFVAISLGATRKNALLVGRLPMAAAARPGKGGKGGATGGMPTTWITVEAGFDTLLDVVGNVGDRLIVRTDAGAARGRIVAIDLAKPERAHWQELVAESADTLHHARIVGGKLVVQLLHDAHSVLRVFGLDGKPLGDIALPAVGTVAELSGDADDSELFLRFTSFTYPGTLLAATMQDLAVRELWAPRLPFAADAFVTEQHFASSRDGTRVPYFLVRRKDVDANGARPVWLHAYGGFDIAMVPAFAVDRLAWVEMGGVFVLANLRGGGEYGDSWHKAGMQGNKQNVFDDFYAVAEDLHRRRWASPATTAIAGGSNGGLLVGAAITQRPALFAAALPAVGVMDMLRFHTWTIGWAWVPEYGSSADAAAFKWLHAYSPLHNAKPQRYPATLVTTADHDDRVVPAHSFKFAAAVQYAQRGDAPILIRIEEKAGHGAGKPTSKRIDEARDRLAFLVQALGPSRFVALPGAATAGKAQ